MSVREPGSQDRQFGQTVDLGEYFDLIMRRKRLVLVTVLVVLMAALGYTLVQTPVYTSKATVLLKPTGVNLTALGALGPEKLINTDTEMQIVRSTVVATQAAPSIETDLTPAQLLSHVSVSSTPDTQTLEISYSDPNRSTAQKGATAFADAYLAYRHQEAQALVASQLDQLDKSITAAQDQLRQLNVTIASLPVNSVRWKNAQTERASVVARINRLENSVTVTSLLNTDPGEVIVDAQVPKHPSSPSYVLNVGLGVFFGLALGVVLAFVRGRTDRHLRTSVDLEGVLGAPLLAAIPLVPGGADGPASLVVAYEPNVRASEAYRALRTTLMAAHGVGEKVLMVVSALPGEGKTTVAANLSVTLAAADKRVVLISADMRRPRVQEVFGLSNEFGLSNILTGEVPVDVGVLDSDIENLFVCPSGPAPPNPAELLQSERMRDLLAHLCRVADYVVLDCPPVLSVADSLALASSVDGAILVVDANRTDRDAVADARRRLEQVGAAVLGGVLNKEPFPGRGKYGYGYEYGYTDDARRNGRAPTPDRAPARSAAGKSTGARTGGLPAGPRETVWPLTEPQVTGDRASPDSGLP